MSLLKKAIKEAGGVRKVAERCKLKSLSSVYKWQKNGLPQSEWLGETNYAEIIATMQDEYNKTMILLDEKMKREERTNR